MYRLDEIRRLTAWALFAILPLTAGFLCAQTPSQAEPELRGPSRVDTPACSHRATVHVVPAKPPTPEALGDTFVVRRQYQAAIAAYAKDPNPSAAIWNKMGLAYQMLRNLKYAARCYKAAVKLDPHNPTVLNNMGTLNQVRGDYGQAERMYRRALKYRPSLPHSHASAVILKNLGTALLSDGKYNIGWEAYREAIAIDPGIFADTNNPSTTATVSAQQRGATNYFMAKGCARAQHIKCAIRHLRLAFDEGFTTVKKVVRSSDFAGIRKKHAFQELLAEEKQNP